MVVEEGGGHQEGEEEAGQQPIDTCERKIDGLILFAGPRTVPQLLNVSVNLLVVGELEQMMEEGRVREVGRQSRSVTQRPP